jgi:DNA-binding NarL/FixJ family response regulator
VLRDAQACGAGLQGLATHNSRPRTDPKTIAALDTQAEENTMHAYDLNHITAAVTHAEPLIAAGLMAALGSQPGIRLADASSWDRGGGGSRPVDVVVTDYSRGLALCRAARDEGGASAAKVLIVTDMDREQEVRQAIERGIHGYVLQRCALDELVQGVRSVARGLRYLTMAVAESMADSLTREALTARETEVLRLLAAGHSNKAIARELDISSSTIKSHVQAILRKLPAASRTEAISLATRRGLLGSERAPADPMAGALWH